MKIVIIGADGMLGSDIARVLKDEDLIPLTIEDLDITDSLATQKVIGEMKPDAVINTAAFHNVPVCETEDQKAWEVNVLGVKHLALACKEVGASLMHISTDYIFDGEKNAPYVEEDAPNPLNVYAVTKLAGEYYLKNHIEEHFICRVSGIYGINKCMAKGSNFVQTMLKLSKERDELKVVTDEIVTPTYTLDVARQIEKLIKTKEYGTYHMTNQGECSWYDFACAIFELACVDIKVSPTTSEEFPSPVNRPSYSVLENKNLKEIGLDIMLPWKEALAEHIEERRAQGKL